MSVEASIGKPQTLSESLRLSIDETRQTLLKSTRNVQAGANKIVNPPYNTPSGKPLEFRHYEPGQVTLFDRKQTRELEKRLKKT